MIQDAIDRAARRLMNLRPSENTVNPYKLVSAAVNALIDQRCTDPLAAGLRHGYPLHNPRLCWGCDGVVDEATLACDCFAPTKTHS